MMEIVEPLTHVYFNDTTWPYIPESYHLHRCHSENLKSHRVLVFAQQGCVNAGKQHENLLQHFCVDVVPEKWL
jgi:hypothetical protein